MINHRSTDSGQLGRRIRLSTREIAISIALTVAALAGIAVFSFGQISDETAMHEPVVTGEQRPE